MANSLRSQQTPAASALQAGEILRRNLPWPPCHYGEQMVLSSCAAALEAVGYAALVPD